MISKVKGFARLQGEGFHIAQDRCCERDGMILALLRAPSRSIFSENVVACLGQFQDLLRASAHSQDARLTLVHKQFEFVSRAHCSDIAG